eukprot:6507364-Pyramimonas_sp.AAC.1
MAYIVFVTCNGKYNPSPRRWSTVILGAGSSRTIRMNLEPDRLKVIGKGGPVGLGKIDPTAAKEGLNNAMLWALLRPKEEK